MIADSAKGFAWQQRPCAPDLLAEHERAGADFLLARLYGARGVTPAQVSSFVGPRIRDLLPDPATLKGMDALIDLLIPAIEAGETIGILADYDVDGATSAGVLVAVLRAMGIAVHLYVPDRLTEGYGPSETAMAAFLSQGIRTVVCVDCGSMAHKVLHAGEGQGLAIGVIDHHQIDGDAPNIRAHINPNQQGCESGIGTCAAVGVCFVAMVGLIRALKAAGHEVPLNLMSLLDLVALGTVCDVVPLKGLNRAFVLQGLKVWKETQNPGLRALLNILPKAPTFDAKLAGFQMGPRLNAAGRIGPSDLAARLLTTQDTSIAQSLAQELDSLNQRRREIEAQVLASARLKLSEQGESPINLVADPGWHPGVVGIVAGRLKDSTGKVSIVLGGDEAGTLTGSGRSIAGFDLGSAVLAMRVKGLLISGGGHAMAAGLKLLPEYLESVREELAGAVAAVPSVAMAAKTREYDLAIRPRAASFALAQALTALAPHGAGNPEPAIVIERARIQHIQPIGKNHLKVTIQDGDGSTLRAVAFRAAGTNLETVLRQGIDRQVALLGTLGFDEWRGGEAVQLIIDDAGLQN